MKTNLDPNDIFNMAGSNKAFVSKSKQDFHDIFGDNTEINTNINVDTGLDENKFETFDKNNSKVQTVTDKKPHLTFFDDPKNKDTHTSSLQVSGQNIQVTTNAFQTNQNTNLTFDLFGINNPVSADKKDVTQNLNVSNQIWTLENQNDNNLQDQNVENQNLDLIGETSKNNNQMMNQDINNLEENLFKHAGVSLYSNCCYS